MTSTVKTIVAGVATLHDADPVLLPAIELARALGARLELVHAFDLPDPWLAEALAEDDVAAPEFAARHTAGLQARLDSLTRELAADVGAVSGRAVPGVASGVLCEVAAAVQADLLLVGATRRGTMSRNILGTTAERVIRGAHAPVLVLREPLRRPLRRALLTTDLSEFSARVHEQALDTLEALFGPELPEVRDLLVVAYDVALPPPLRQELLEGVAEQELHAFLAARRVRPYAVQPQVRVGEPAKEIVAEAFDWSADLLVMGTHGRTGFSRMMLGSVAGASVRSALCNVLVLPGAALVEGHAPRGSTGPRPASR